MVMTRHLILVLALCFAGCGESNAPASDATVDRADVSDAVSDAVADAPSQDVSTDVPMDALMDANLGADASSDAPDSADAHD